MRHTRMAKGGERSGTPEARAGNERQPSTRHGAAPRHLNTRASSGGRACARSGCLRVGSLAVRSGVGTAAWRCVHTRFLHWSTRMVRFQLWRDAGLATDLRSRLGERAEGVDMPKGRASRRGMGCGGCSCCGQGLGRDEALLGRSSRVTVVQVVGGGCGVSSVGWLCGVCVRASVVRPVAVARVLAGGVLADRILRAADQPRQCRPLDAVSRWKGTTTATLVGREKQHRTHTEEATEARTCRRLLTSTRNNHTTSEPA